MAVLQSELTIIKTFFAFGGGLRMSWVGATLCWLGELAAAAMATLLPKLATAPSMESMQTIAIEPDRDPDAARSLAPSRARAAPAARIVL